MKLYNERVIHFCQNVSLHLRSDSVPNCKTEKQRLSGGRNGVLENMEHKTLATNNLRQRFIITIFKQTQKLKQ